MSVTRGTIDTKSLKKKLRVGCFGWVELSKWGSDIAPADWLIRKRGDRCLGCVRGQGISTDIVPCNQPLQSWHDARGKTTKCSACRQWRNEKQQAGRQRALESGARTIFPTQCNCTAGKQPGKCRDCAQDELEAHLLHVSQEKKRKRKVNGLFPSEKRANSIRDSKVITCLRGKAALAAMSDEERAAVEKAATKAAAPFKTTQSRLSIWVTHARPMRSEFVDQAFP